MKKYGVLSMCILSLLLAVSSFKLPADVRETEEGKQFHLTYWSRLRILFYRFEMQWVFFYKTFFVLVGHIHILLDGI